MLISQQRDLLNRDYSHWNRQLQELFTLTNLQLACAKIKLRRNIFTDFSTYSLSQTLPENLIHPSVLHAVEAADHLHIISCFINCFSHKIQMKLSNSSFFVSKLLGILRALDRTQFVLNVKAVIIDYKIKRNMKPHKMTVADGGRS